MSTKKRYLSLLSSFRRTVGFYKRYGIDVSGEYKQVKNPTEASIKRLEKERELARTRGQIELEKRKKGGENEKAKVWIKNLLYKIRDFAVSRSGRALTQAALDASLALISDIIKRALGGEGLLEPREVKERLEDFAADIEQQLGRMIRAIYDDEYRNESYFDGPDEWKKDRRGATEYARKLKQLSEALNVEPNANLLASMGGGVYDGYN